MNPTEKLNTAQQEFANYLHNEICGENEALKKASDEIKYHGTTPSPEFSKLIKDKSIRDKYCLLGIELFESQLAINKSFVKKITTLPIYKSHSVITISLIVGALLMHFFSSTIGLIGGAISYWFISEEVIERNKVAEELRPLDNEWCSEIKKLRAVLSKELKKGVI